MATIGATQLIMGFLGLRESEVDSIQPIPDAMLIKIGRSKLDRTMTGVTYALSMEQGFLIIFDSDYAGQAVVQKTFWGEGTDAVYNMVKRRAVPAKVYPGSTGFFIYSQQLGYLLVERQTIEGKECITVSRECVL
jgi:hypothetical protein